jgi:hypothetical protein
MLWPSQKPLKFSVFGPSSQAALSRHLTPDRDAAVAARIADIQAFCSNSASSMTAARTKPSLVFGILLTQHFLASAVTHILQRSGIHRTSRSSETLDIHFKPTFRCAFGELAGRRQSRLVQSRLLPMQHTFVLTAKFLLHCI